MSKLPTPSIIQPIHAFDPSDDQPIYFSCGSSQLKKVHYLIVDCSDSDTNGTSISQTQDTMAARFYIPGNNLKPGKKYSIRIKISDASQDENAQLIWSEYSEAVIFYCYTTPALEFEGLTEGMTYNNASIDLQLRYEQKEKEPLSSYQFFVYAYDKTLLSCSDIYYTASSPELNYTVYGLDNNAVYYFMATGVTKNGMNLNTGYLQINTQFQTLPPNAILHLENHAHEGYVSIKTNILNIGYELEKKDEAHFKQGNGEITLVNNSLSYNKGYELEDDFSLFVEAKFLTLNHPFLICYDGQTPIFSLSIVNVCGPYYCRLEIADSDLSYHSMLPNAKLCTEDKRILLTEDEKLLEIIDVDTEDKYVIFEVKRKNGLFSLNTYYKSDAES